MSPNSNDNLVHVGAYGLCRDQKGRLLMARLMIGPDNGRWTLPGGGVLWGEHPDQAVLREMEEEAGLVDLTIVSIASIYSHTYTNTDSRLPPLQHIGIIYSIEPRSYQLHHEQDGEIDICQWLTESEARSLPQTPLGEYGISLVWPLSPT